MRGEWVVEFDCDGHGEAILFRGTEAEAWAQRDNLGCAVTRVNSSDRVKRFDVWEKDGLRIKVLEWEKNNG